MITYEKYPISVAEASRIKAWLNSAEANLFKELVSAQMHVHFFDSINLRCRHAETSLDRSKNENLASIHAIDGSDVRHFIETFEDFSKPDHGFFKLKVNT